MFNAFIAVFKGYQVSYALIYQQQNVEALTGKLSWVIMKSKEKKGNKETKKPKKDAKDKKEKKDPNRYDGLGK